MTGELAANEPAVGAVPSDQPRSFQPGDRIGMVLMELSAPNEPQSYLSVELSALCFKSV
jgi:hypothetical protein